jgi:hypothetical protein
MEALHGHLMVLSIMATAGVFYAAYLYFPAHRTFMQVRDQVWREIGDKASNIALFHVALDAYKPHKKKRNGIVRLLSSCCLILGSIFLFELCRAMFPAAEASMVEGAIPAIGLATAVVLRIRAATDNPCDD